MIKFYKGTSTQLSGKISDGNNICFLTDTSTLVMSGQAFGKDQVKVGAIGTLSSTAYVGDIIIDSTTNKIYKKTGAAAVEEIIDVVSIAQGKADAVSAVISTAFANGKIVLGNGSGITSSNFVPDTTSGDFNIAGGTAASLSSTLVNAATLKTQIASINTTVNSSKVELSGGSGVSATSAALGNAGADGVRWTISATVSDSPSSSLGFDANGKLADNLEIRKLATATTGYAASYALFNTKGETAVQLGSTIDIVKDQFLKSAELVTGTWTPATSTWSDTGTTKYIKFTFAVNTDGTETTNVIYLNVNDLFDSYTSGDGVTVNNDTNKISINKDSSSESFLSVSSSGLKVSGIQTAINSAITGLGQTTATAGQYLTQVGVNSSGNLTGSTAQISAGQVAFTAITSSATTVAVTGTDVAAAIASLGTAVKTAENNALTGANSAISAAIQTLDVAQTGDSTTYIQYISEADGKISAQSATLDASKVAYGTGSTVSAALTGIADQISNMSANAGGTGKYITTISQTNGVVSATDADLTATAVSATTVAAVATGANATVGFTASNVQAALEDLAKKIADYGSFHNADDSLA